MKNSLFSTDSNTGVTFTISPHGQGCKLSVEPEYRRISMSGGAIRFCFSEPFFKVY